MREIVLRAWDEDKEAWLNDNYAVVFNNDGFVIEDEWCKYHDPAEGQPLFEQFTGLHDKNGQKIYEGDVVEWKDFDNKRVGYVTFSPDIKFVTANHDYNFGVFAYQDTKKYLTVIGNVHENPELMEQ